ncbi:hypothetical protein NA57DRAFT_73430 [Rhizodiscina lignyota]|uniref:Uncharacterized protein n=1 Tax=Rhizodiscina lignyota TaxID=1504668 RepID=A0A9P4II58_9PEZI|nr:hypothetical protein NA57DRAFT_73430 [Rhizodiscina lignyota]
MPTAGLLFAKTSPKHPDLTEEVFNKWYSTEHIQDVVDAGLADLAIRYKNLDPKAKYQYLAVYRIPDVSKLSDEKFMATIKKDSKLLPGKEPGKNGEWPDVLDAEIPGYEILQSFEGPNDQKTRAKGIVTVAMEPAEGTDDDFDDWYRKQHLDMISMCRGYHRSTRYKKLDGSKPRYLAIHEYETTDFPGDQLKVVVGTEWSKKVIKNSPIFDRNMWEYITEYRKGGQEKL